MTSLWTLADLTAYMDTLFPPSTAEEWDRVGLVLGNPVREIRKILLAVDPVAATVDEAIATGADLLLTHHPLYLRGTSFLPESDPKGSLVARLIRANIGLFTAHTNADVAAHGVAQSLADLVGLADTEVLAPAGVDSEGRPIGLGRVGTVPEMTLGAFADEVARKLPAGPHGLFVGGDESQLIHRVAVSGGSGDHFLSAARFARADVYLSADLRHHPASESLEGGSPALLCGSHWATEWPWLPVLARQLRDEAARSGVSLEVEVSTIVTEPWTAHRPTIGGTQ
ncbi:MAG: Nif3-like dinuclear metal center hexameric protein [Actinomycetaceae bacterium]|nr:Nif3-like dinuclear metal center hexameric protein [Actinomycetaceae bacterium]